MKVRTYHELCKLNTFRERFGYLQLCGEVGADTFGFDRYLNQEFYRSVEWRRIRDFVIVRDDACDMGLKGYNLINGVIVHHMNPLSVDDILNSTDFLLNPEYLITVSLDTHNAIHFGDERLLNDKIPVERTAGDTCPWRR